MPRVRSAALATALFCLSVLVPSPVTAAAPRLTAKVIQSNLVIPWDIAFAPTGQMFVTERPGRLRVYRNAKAGATLLATTTISNVRAEGESGLMGIAVDHAFATNRFIYLCASRTYHGQWLNQVIRYHVDSSWHADFDRYLISLGMHANTIHNGCAVQEGPDQKIWVTMGDGNHPMWAQDPDRRNGKVLRVNRDGSIPSDNPVWPGHINPSLVYSIGHRNPQGITFEPGTGRVYAVEHGPDRDDEINWIRPGRNYGWPCRTGKNHVYLSCPGAPTFTGPAWSTEGPTLATSNGTFVHGSAWEGWNDSLFVATLKESDLRRFTVNAGTFTLTMRNTLYNQKWGRLRATVRGPGGRQLFITTSNGSNDRVIRITPS